MQGLEWILSCQKNLRKKWGCTKDLFYSGGRCFH